MRLLLGAATLQMARHYWSVGESVAGALYLLCGAIFPLDSLPGWLRPVGMVLPLTYWLESLRRSLLGCRAALPAKCACRAGAGRSSRTPDGLSG